MSESSPEIRNAFVRKVYTILCTLKPYPIQNRNPRITKPPLLLVSRSDRKSHAFCVIHLLNVSRYLARHNYCWRHTLSIPIRRALGPSQVRSSSLSHRSAPVLIRCSPWSYYLPMFGVFINLGLLYWKRHAHPLNLVLLSTFTLLEAFTLGILCAYFDTAVVLQALCVRLSRHRLQILDVGCRLITSGVFLGLTAFTFQSKVCRTSNNDYPLLRIYSMTFPAWVLGSSVASLLSVSSFPSHQPLLLKHCGAVAGMTGIVGIFIPFSRTIDLLYAIGGTIIFSGYIVYDTYLINARLSPDEYIMAAISLYLECVLYY